jgi:TonB family protein
MDSDRMRARFDRMLEGQRATESTARRWFPAAAAAVLLAALFIGLMSRSGGPGTEQVVVETAGSHSSYNAGDKIRAGTIIRASDGDDLVLKLRDGSRVEVRSKSELLVEVAERGQAIRLKVGGIIVSAAPQQPGHRLSVQTKDAVISVAGTVFLVDAGESTTRTAVIEGEVRLEQGSHVTTLRRGEQWATAPSMELGLISEAIGWSREAKAYVALLEKPQSSVAPAPILTAPIQTAPVTVLPIETAPVSAPPVQSTGPQTERNEDEIPPEMKKVIGEYLEQLRGVSSGVYSSESDGVIRPRVLSSVKPGYTEEARQNRISGTVTLDFIVDTNGEVEPNVVLVSRPVGYGLDEQAIEAVRRWRFSPATKDGVPVKFRLKTEISFSLR